MLLRSATDYIVSLDAIVVRTQDSGASWTDVSQGVRGLSSGDLYIADNGRLFHSGNYTSGIRVSIDDGATWDYRYDDPLNRDIRGFLKGTASGTFYGYGSGLVKTTDNGLNWTAVNTSQFLETLATNNGTTLYSYFNGDLLTSTDAGVTWTSQELVNFPANGSLSDSRFFLDQNGILFLKVYNPALIKQQLYKVDPANATMVLVSTITDQLNDFHYFNGKLYATTNLAQLLVSSDAGATWAVKTAPVSYSRVKVIDSNTIYLLTDGGLYLSTDGASSWVYSGNFGTNSAWPYDVEVSPSNYSYVSVDQNVVYKSNAQIIPPVAPSALTVIGKTAERISLMFTDNSTTETYFIIERSQDNNTSYDSIGTVTRPNTYVQPKVSLTTGQLKTNTTYYYRVRASSPAGKSAYSNEVSATTDATNCMASSTLPNNRSWTATTLNQSGQGVKGPAQVTIIGSAGIYTVSNIGAFTAAPGVFAGLTPTIVEPWANSFMENCGSTFLIGTTRVIPNGQGTWDANTGTLTLKWQTHPQRASRIETTQFVLNAQDPTPTVPTNPVAYVSATNTVQLSWASALYVEQYVVERSTTSGSTGFAEIGRVSHDELIYVDNTVTAGNTYYYRVYSYSSKGSPSQVSAASSSVSITVQQPLFSAIQVSPYNSNYRISYGATWTDFDSDGFDDLVVPYQGTELVLKSYRNKTDGTFEEVSLGGISAQLGTWFGISSADLNNDGKMDLFATTNSTGQNTIWTNQGNNNFAKTELVKPSLPNYTPSIADFNNDGLLDIVNSSLSTSLTSQWKVFTQKPDNTFVPYEVGELVTDAQNSWSHSWADYDNDNDLDLLIDGYNTALANTRLYRNEGSDANGFKGFTKVTGTAFETEIDMTGESSSWGDFDNDGDLDVFRGNTSPSPTLNDMLYQNNGDGTFTRLTSSLPAEIIPSTYYTNSSAWGDIDNDGDLDLLVVRDPQSALYLNAGNGTFTKYNNVEFITAFDTQKSNSNGIFSDYDQDGDLDLYLNLYNTTLPIYVLRNLSTTGKWIEFKLQGTTSNRSAIGARVTLNLPNGKKQIREVTTTSGWGAQNSLVVHFGLGATTVIPSVTIRWPSGITQTLTNVSSNQIVNVLEDGTGPSVAQTLPANAAVKVPLATSLEVTFNETPQAVASKFVTVTPVEPAGTPFTIDASTGVVAGTKVTFALATPLSVLTKYSVSIEAGAFTDVYGNSMAAYTSSWTFTTLDNVAPVFSATAFSTPLAKGFTSQKFSATVTDNGTVAAVTLSYRGANTTGAYTDMAGTYNSTSGMWEFTVVETTYNTIGLEFYFTAKDAEDNLKVEPATGVLQSLFEKTPPQVSHTAPAALMAKGFGTQTFTITASDNFGVTSTVMSYRNTKDGTTYATLNGTQSPTEPTSYSFLVPESAYNGNGLEYFFTVTDATGNSTRIPAESASPSTNRVLLDNEAPAFAAFTASLALSKANTTFRIKATDNLAVQRVVMKYRGIAGKNFTTSAAGQLNANGEYEFAVSQDWFDEMGIEYYFRAVDQSKNIAVSPDTTKTTGTYHRTFVKLSGEAQQHVLPLIPGSSGASGYQIVSVPLELTNKNIADNFGDELGTGDKAAYRFLRYRHTPAPAWDEYPGGGLSLLNRGEGYFINVVKTGVTQIKLLDGEAPKNDQSNPFQLTLKKGWNQIGNPYTVLIRWADVLAFNNNPAGVGKLWKFEGTSYNDLDATGSIEPYKGGFVLADNDITLKIPFVGMTGGKTTIPSTDLSAMNWEFRFILRQDDHENVAALVGMHPQASLTKDDFDSPVLPHFADFVEASFAHPEYEMKKFSQDIVPTANEYMWEFDVASSLKGQATMGWNNATLGNNSKQLVLFDVARQQVVDMRSQNSYVFDPRQSAKFRIYFGENVEKKIQATRLTLRAHPNPSSGVVGFAFSIPDQKTKKHVALEIFDVIGRRVAIITDQSMTGGFYEASWDGTTQLDGFYVCRLSVIGDGTQESTHEKIVLKK